jgi:hypothetical protein
MALVFHRRLAVPLWAIAFFAVALAPSSPATVVLTPPITLFVILAVATAAIAGAISWLRTSRSLVRVLSSGHGIKVSPAITLAAGTCVRTVVEPNGGTPDDALDLVRMDDDGGWQLLRPPA